MKRKLFLLVLMFLIAAICVIQNTYGQVNPYPNLEIQKIEQGDNFIYYYILHNQIGAVRSKTLIIYLVGSGLDSALGLQQNEAWEEDGLFIKTLNRYFSPRFDILVPEKMNVTPGRNHDGDPKALEHYSFPERVASAAVVIDAFLKEREYQNVILLGASEGAFILPKVYQQLERRGKIDGLVSLGGGGISQYEEFQLLADSPLPMPEGYRVGLQQVDEVFAAIQKDPESLEKRYLGLTYRRWSGFMTYRPLDDFVAIDIPILIMHGAKDVMAPVEGSRSVVAEFRKRNKTNLTYFEYPDGDHRFNGDFEMVLEKVEKWFMSQTERI